MAKSRKKSVPLPTRKSSSTELTDHPPVQAPPVQSHSEPPVQPSLDPPPADEPALFSVAVDDRSPRSTTTDQSSAGNAHRARAGIPFSLLFFGGLFFLLSAAGVVAIYEVINNPHRWFNRERTISVAAVIENEESQTADANEQTVSNNADADHETKHVPSETPESSTIVARSFDDDAVSDDADASDSASLEKPTTPNSKETTEKVNKPPETKAQNQPKSAAEPKPDPKSNPKAKSKPTPNPKPAPKPMPTPKIDIGPLALVDRLAETTPKCQKFRFRPTSEIQVLQFIDLLRLVSEAIAVEDDDQIEEGVRGIVSGIAREVIPDLKKTQWPNDSLISTLNQPALASLKTLDGPIFAYCRVVVPARAAPTVNDQPTIGLEIIGSNRLLLYSIDKVSSIWTKGSRWMMIGIHTDAGESLTVQVGDDDEREAAFVRGKILFRKPLAPLPPRPQPQKPKPAPKKPKKKRKR